ncbi:biliverdin-producing heme oxygenase [Sphingomonas gei]|uniref:Biliverdin-producing heme oxygenase n=1 Tax=Sphingomonas gei TaxID=1395960 RepID=A0A4S1X4A4_9SPHN|nr:biliverdin-producing heme oxygenase [Sphingomonas gei]TGX49116.1 biliverdin-producing heme oxygenase [Sphingomonas gei]
MSELIADRAPGSEQTSRAKRLRASTQAVHEQLDTSITLARILDSVEGYRRFVGMQFLFHRDIDALYRDERLQSVISGLEQRRRLPLIERDLADLRLARPSQTGRPVFGADASADVATALGWLYVAEGSNLGASLLRKEVAKIGLSDTYGARHLAPTAEGPAAHWRSFTDGLNAAPLNEEEEVRVVTGAQAAFAHVQALTDACIL